MTSLVFCIITNNKATKHDIAGISTVTHLIYSDNDLNYGSTVIVNKTIPFDNSSKNEQHPNTNAPEEPFIPITSDINVTPVFSNNA